MKDLYDTDVSNGARFAELAAAAVDDGFSAMKAMAVPPTMPLEGLPISGPASRALRPGDA